MNKLLTAVLLSSVITLSVQAQKAEEYYVKHVEFPPNATLEQKVDMAARLIPTPQQLSWQQMELTAFLHFGINTFTGREWGDGKEDPALFNPSELDAEQCLVVAVGQRQNPSWCFAVRSTILNPASLIN